MSDVNVPSDRFAPDPEPDEYVDQSVNVLTDRFAEEEPPEPVDRSVNVQTDRFAEEAEEPAGESSAPAVQDEVPEPAQGDEEPVSAPPPTPSVPPAVGAVRSATPNGGQEWYDGEHWREGSGPAPGSDEYAALHPETPQPIKPRASRARKKG